MGERIRMESGKERNNEKTEWIDVDGKRDDDENKNRKENENENGSEREGKNEHEGTRELETWKIKYMENGKQENLKG